jgi:hypothetical protein
LALADWARFRRRLLDRTFKPRSWTVPQGQTLQRKPGLRRTTGADWLKISAPIPVPDSQALAAELSKESCIVSMSVAVFFNISIRPVFLMTIFKDTAHQGLKILDFTTIAPCRSAMTAGFPDHGIA